MEKLQKNWKLKMKNVNTKKIVNRMTQKKYHVINQEIKTYFIKLLSTGFEPGDSGVGRNATDPILTDRVKTLLFCCSLSCFNFCPKNLYSSRGFEPGVGSNANFI